MAVSFLDLTPKAAVATVTVEGEAGAETYEITGLTLSQLADIVKRFPSFLRVVEGDAPLLTASDALTAIIAAGLGQCGNVDYERKAASMPGGLALSVAGEIMGLTFARGASPLPNGADVVAAAAPSRTSPPPSSSS
jgi:hypothetical protein